MGATAEFARWIASTNYEDIPPEAIGVANEACFDCLGVMLAGAGHPLGQNIVGYLRESGGTPESTVVGAGLKTTAAQAALGNGTLGHAHDYDDFGGFGHPTTVVFPALLALGEKTGATGREVLGAYVVGVEVGINLIGGGMDSGRYSQMERGFHSTGVFGRMAAAAACAKLLGLDQHQTAMALGLAGSMAGGLIHNFGTMTKPLHPGMAARDGVMAAELASRGWTAGDQILEHPAGFVATFFEKGVANPNDLAKNLGNPFRTQDSIIIKKYPTCGGNHSMLDSLIAILQENNLSYEDIESVQVDNESPTSVVQLYREPKDGLTGKFSMLYNAARTILDAKITMNTFTDEAVADPRVKESMTKVHIPVRSRWEPAITPDPKGTTQSLSYSPVTVRTKDGRIFTKAVDVHEVIGSQKHPWGMDNITAKFRECASLALSDAQVEEAVRTWSSIGEITDLAGALQKVVANGASIGL